MGESQEIKDFTKKTEETNIRSAKKGIRNKTGAASDLFDRETISMLILFAAVAAAVITILLGVLVFQIPAATACAVVLLEAAIAACLMEVPVWLHGFVVIVQVAAGIWLKNTGFLLCGVLIYLLSGFALRYRRKIR